MSENAAGSSRLRPAFIWAGIVFPLLVLSFIMWVYSGDPDDFEFLSGRRPLAEWISRGDDGTPRAVRRYSFRASLKEVAYAIDGELKGKRFRLSADKQGWPTWDSDTLSIELSPTKIDASSPRLMTESPDWVSIVIIEDLDDSFVNTLRSAFNRPPDSGS